MEGFWLTMFAIAMGLTPLFTLMVISKVAEWLVRRRIKTGKEKVVHWYEPRNYGTNSTLDLLLNFCLDKGVKTNAYDNCSICEGRCEFENGWVFYYWNRNIPYAWLCRGRFEYNGEVVYEYDGGMPSKQTMNRFYNTLCEYYKKKMLSL